LVLDCIFAPKQIMPLMHAALTDPEYGFDVRDENGHVLRIDVPIDQGGGGTGFRPMQTMLAALCGCSGVDVVSILKKQKQELTGLEIKIDGEREKGKEPSLWETLHVRFELAGVVEPGKAWRAVDLSVNKYCSVAETLRRAGAVITWSVAVNGQDVNTNGA
jgi:putative redox protein